MRIQLDDGSIVECGSFQVLPEPVGDNVRVEVRRFKPDKTQGEYTYVETIRAKLIKLRQFTTDIGIAGMPFQERYTLAVVYRRVLFPVKRVMHVRDSKADYLLTLPGTGVLGDWFEDKRKPVPDCMNVERLLFRYEVPKD